MHKIRNHIECLSFRMAPDFFFFWISLYKLLLYFYFATVPQTIEKLFVLLFYKPAWQRLPLEGKLSRLRLD